MRFRGREVKRGSLMWRLLGLGELHNPDSQLRKTLDKIAKGDSEFKEEGEPQSMEETTND